MKATLEFNLPDEEEQHQLAVDAAKWKQVVVEMDNRLRNRMKYDKTSASAHKELSTAREQLFASLVENGLNLYD